MQFHSLSFFDKEKCNHSSTSYRLLLQTPSFREDAEGYENLLYTVRRPYSPEMLDEIDNWMGLPKRQWRRRDTERSDALFVCYQVPRYLTNRKSN